LAEHGAHPDADTAEAVRQALFTYARGVDRRDRALIIAAFAVDAHISLGSIYSGGPEGFADVAMGFMGMFAATRHDIANVRLVRRDDGAIGYEAYVRTWHLVADSTRELVVLGRYIGVARHGPHGWQLAEHGELMDWGEERAVDAGWFTANAELEKGRRDTGDASYSFV
jgi:hypothetical protein